MFLEEIEGVVVCIVMVIEFWDGCLCVFMLLVEVIEDYFELIFMVEVVVDDFGLLVYIEGYLLLLDLRMNVIWVVLDLGVIEVNIYLVSSW